ncbi:putative 2-component regulator [Sulfolobus monocaudavirus SMV4]|uniref:ATPase n=1 Tax=Sulfolobus monocaudavirus SMV4 TaxID=1732178 RepID=UPI0007066AC7|nr:ATPase [Sulfolobus monocaudavirus SMV4]ALG97048.1 putative 2-component regulator [Sulfolobus monocaudavirus SMV4]
MQLQEQEKNSENLSSPADVSTIARRLKDELDKYVVGNEDVKTAVITGLLTGFPTLLIGDPGTAKTYTIEILSKMIDGIKPEELFIVLAHEAMTPEDIFGNANLKKLREEGVLEYITEGFLPSAKLVFIDEIFKSNKVLAESLFRAINEKKFRNGSKEISLPWLAFFSASNEVRVNTQADRAFLDRFKIFATVLSPNLEDIQNLRSVAERYYKVLTATKPTSIPTVTSYDEVKKIQDKILSDYTKYVTQDTVLEAVKQANVILGAIAQALQNPRAFSDSGVVRSYFKSMGGYLTISERKFKSIMQTANALREMFGNSTITPVHTSLAFYLTIPFTPELKNIISPIISALIKSYFNTSAFNNSSIDINSLVDSISKVAEKILTNKNLNNLLNKASTYAIDLIAKTFPATTPDLARYKADLVKKFSAVTSNNDNTPQKLADFMEAVGILYDVATKYANNIKIRTLAQKLLQNIASTVYDKIDVDRITSDAMNELQKAYDKIKAEIESKYNELMKLGGNDENSKLIAGIRKFFPQFSDALPGGIVDQEQKEEIMKRLDEAVGEARTKILDFMNTLGKTKNALLQMTK